MTHPFRAVTRAALMLAIPAWLVANAATAQEQKAVPSGGGGGGGAKAGPAPSAPSGGGGGTASAGSPSGGGSSSGGGNAGGSGSTRGGSNGEGGHRGGGATGSSGNAMPREGRNANSGGNAGSAAPRGSSAAGGGNSGSAGNSGSGVHSAVPSGERGRRANGGEAAGKATSTGSAAAGSGVPAYARPRDNGSGDPVGTAVPRGTNPRPPSGGGGIYIPGGYYGPYGYGYGYGYVDPWAYGSGGYGFYGGYYDPWYGGYPADPQGGGGYTTASNDEGKLRLKIRPREAEVYVDGYYVGQVDDFDGIFQRLHLDSGPHRIEVRAPGYESLSFEVRITPDHTTTYQGELKKLQ